jgi:hypothetical protein
MAKPLKIDCNRKKIVRITGNKPLRIVPINIAGVCTKRDVIVAWTYSGIEEHPDEGMEAMTWDADGTPKPPIYNLCELNHDGPVIFGINMSLSNYPPEFRPRPVDGGGNNNDHKVNRLVEVWSMTGCDCDNSIWIMNEMSAHDGDCGLITL